MKEGKKYIYVFLITCGIFLIAWSVSTYFNNKKITQIKDIQDKVAVDILSSETQYSLLEELSCTDVDNSLLSQEIGALADRIGYAEQNVSGAGDIQLLKEQYTILEVKDFLLSNRIGERCGNKPVTILYFYGKKDECEDCVKEGYVLDALHELYPDIRVYSFDFNLDLSTIRALKSIYKIDNTLPALVVNGKTVTGFKTLDDISALLPKEFIKQQAQKTTLKKVQ